MNQLKDGLVPANTRCPWADECRPDCPAAQKNGCPVDYSCGLARALNIRDRHDDKRETKEVK
jgi:hypothetical protein